LREKNPNNYSTLLDLFGNNSNKKIEPRPKWKNGDPIVSGVHVSEDMNKKGARKKKMLGGPHMEDMNFVQFPFHGNTNFALICVFDGHAGVNCATEAKKVFPEEFYQKISSQTNSIDLKNEFEKNIRNNGQKIIKF